MTPSRVLFGFALLGVLTEIPLFAEEQPEQQKATAADKQPAEKLPVPAAEPPRPPNDKRSAGGATKPEDDLEETIDRLHRLLDHLEQVRQNRQADSSKADRDPFSTTKTMQQRAHRQQSGTPAPQSINLPSMRIKGIAAGETGSSVALLEVEGNETYFIRQGETLNLAPATGPLLVKEITGEVVKMEIPSVGQVITVR